MATLREIQLVELEMMKFLDKLCTDNGLRYSMIGGTMLGAVRHKGFIPWDDDIDVYMPMDDVQKLKELFKSDIYFLQVPETDIQMPFLMMKLRKNGSQMIEPGTEELDIHQGIWLDIFPYVEAGGRAFSLRVQKFLREVLQTYRCRYRYCSGTKKRIIHSWLAKRTRKTQLRIDKLINSVIEGLGSKKSGKILALDAGAHSVFPCRYFDEVERYQFEDGEFFGPKDYDGYLTEAYGKDYMIPKQWNHIGDYSDVIV